MATAIRQIRVGEALVSVISMGDLFHHVLEVEHLDAVAHGFLDRHV